MENKYLFGLLIWNMVGGCEKCNGKKSNHIVQEKYMDKIQDRNLDEEFRLNFFQDKNYSSEFAQNINKILEQHYRNCLFHLRKIDL